MHSQSGNLAEWRTCVKMVFYLFKLWLCFKEACANNEAMYMHLVCPYSLNKVTDVVVFRHAT